MEEMRKNTKNVTHDTRSPEYEAEFDESAMKFGDSSANR